jgi:hypothetical protein
MSSKKPDDLENFDYEMEMEKYSDEQVIYYLKHNDECTEIQLTVKTETPMSLAEFQAALLCFVDDSRRGCTGENVDWILDTEMEMQ